MPVLRLQLERGRDARLQQGRRQVPLVRFRAHGLLLRGVHPRLEPGPRQVQGAAQGARAEEDAGGEPRGDLAPAKAEGDGDVSAPERPGAGWTLAQGVGWAFVIEGCVVAVGLTVWYCVAHFWR